MKVKEIIEKLQKTDQEKEVVIICSGDNPLDYGNEIKEVFEIEGTKENDFVYILED